MRRTMPADMKNMPKNNSLAFTLWLNKMEKASTQEDGLARAPTHKKNIAKKNTTFESNTNSAEEIIMEESTKANKTIKKACICAPTKHAGSFRCHLHRTKKSCTLQPDTDNKSRTNGETQQRMSRFGRAEEVN